MKKDEKVSSFFILFFYLKTVYDILRISVIGINGFAKEEIKNV